MFIRFMCFLPGYFSAGRFADLALPKVPVERDNGPTRCQGEHDSHDNATGTVGGRPLDATASLTVQPILPLPPHTFSCCIKREQLPKLSVADSIAIARSTLRTCGASVGRPTMR
jgi:hypothetical protein